MVGLIYLFYSIFDYDKSSPSKIVTSESTTPTNKSIETTSPTNSSFTTTNYTILDPDVNSKRGFRVSVRISEKISDDQLKSIAQKVKEQINAISDKGMMFFLLPEMVGNNGAWAAVDFDPDMKVRLLGQSVSDEQKIKSQLSNITDYIGLWIDNQMQGEIIIRIRKDKKEGLVIENISPTDPKPSEFATPIIKVTKNGKTIFKDTEHPEQYFLLEKNGDLSVYDNYGFFTTYKKIK